MLTRSMFVTGFIACIVLTFGLGKMLSKRVEYGRPQVQRLVQKSRHDKLMPQHMNYPE